MTLAERMNEHSEKLSTLLLSLAVACLAFGAHEVGSWEPSVAALIAVGAGACWAGSFLAGMVRGHALYDALRFNAALNAAGPEHADAKEFKRSFDRANRAAGRGYLWQRWLLFAGAGLFSVAAMTNVAAKADEANDRRCLALQRDMLSAQPRRGDSIELFKALACKPQGAGSIYAPAQVRGRVDALRPASVR